MLINFNTINNLPDIQKLSNNKINFTSNTQLNGDTFQPQIHISDNCLLTEDECKRFINIIDKSDTDYKGINASFYKINDIGIKKTKKSLEKEELALYYLNGSGIDNIPKSKGTFRYKDYFYLLSDIKSGISPSIDNGVRLTSKNILSLMDTFFKMDQALFLHYDLHKGNILIDDNNVNIVDFDSYNIILDDGKAYSSEDIKSINFKYGLNSCPEEKLIKVLSNSDKFNMAYEWNYVDNPNLPIRSNLTNFEFRLLSNYTKKLESINSNEAEEFFANYLLHKANYHSKRLETFSPLTLKLNSSAKKDYFKTAMEYEAASANVLKHPNKTIIEIEKAKMNLKEILFLKFFTSDYDNNNDKVIKQIYNSLLDKIKYIKNSFSSSDMQLYAKSQYKIYTNNYWKNLFRFVL